VGIVGLYLDFPSGSLIGEAETAIGTRQAAFRASVSRDQLRAILQRRDIFEKTSRDILFMGTVTEVFPYVIRRKSACGNFALACQMTDDDSGGKAVAQMQAGRLRPIA
jgi:hypothetical protein